MNTQMKLELPVKWGWLMALGAWLIISGSAGVVLAFYLTLASVIVFGALALVAGITQLWYGLAGKTHNWSGRALHLLVAIAYLALGGLLLWDPISGTLSLTLVLASFLLTIGIFRIIYAWQCRQRGWRWGWGVFGGVLDLILAGLIIYGWPATALWVIGLFVGIEMILTGWLLVDMALAVRALHKQVRADAMDASAHDASPITS